MSFLISKHVENRITYVTLFKSIIRVQNFFCRVDISNLLIKLEEILCPKVQIIQSHAISNASLDLDVIIFSFSFSL